MHRGKTLALALGLGLVTARAGADDPPAPRPEPFPEAPAKRRLRWDRAWRPFELGDHIWTGGMLGAYLAIQFGLPSAHTPNFVGPILFDEAARTAFLADDEAARERWATFSDVGWWASMAAPWVTGTVIPLVDDWNWEVFYQVNLINAQSLVFAGFVSRVGHVFVGRKRPDENRNNAGFPGGHASGAFTGAGASCVHHLYLGLFGHPAADGAWCGFVMGLATAAALARNVADRHWMTDTIAGAGVGLVSGLGIPLIFHYGLQGRTTNTELGTSWLVTPAAVGEAGIGLGLAGSL